MKFFFTFLKTAILKTINQTEFATKNYNNKKTLNKK
jgi:hypothetical protein